MFRGQFPSVAATTPITDHLAGVKVLHGLDKVVEGGAVVLTIKDQPILADGDTNEEVDMLENVEIGEQKRREEAYKAVKKKTDIYDDKFSDDLSVEKKILPQYDDLAAEEGFTLDEKGRFSGEAEKKPEELRRRLTGVSANNFEDLTSSGKVSSDYYSHEEMLQFEKSEKKKSLSKKDKLDINALEAEAISSGLGVGDLGSRKDAKRQAMKDEKERLEAEVRNNAYQSAYAKEDEACKLLHQTFNVKTEEDETSVYALFATSEVEEFVRRHHIYEEAHKREHEEVFIHDVEVANVPDKKKNDEAGQWTEVKETNKGEQPNSEDKKMVPDDTIHEVAMGKGLSGALKLLNFVGILDGEGKEEQNKKKIHIERTDEFGKIVSLPCSSTSFLFIFGFYYSIKSILYSVLGGDFRQILPVIPKGTRQEIVYASINASYLWQFCEVMTLTKNMRLQTGSSNTDVNQMKQFSDWLLSIGEGTIGDEKDEDMVIEIPNDMIIQNSRDPLASIVNDTYPSLLDNFVDPAFFKDRAILTPKK